MAETNLFRIDDLLIRWGVLGVLVLAAAAFVLQPIASHVGAAPGSDLGVAWLLLGGLCCAPVAMLATGFRLRQRERRAQALLRLVSERFELSAADLIDNSDWTADSLDRAIRDLNDAGVASLVWDRKSNVVQDGGLREARLQFDECPSCGAKLALHLTLAEADTARCPYCMDRIDVRLLEDERQRILDELEERRSRHGEVSRSGDGAKDRAHEFSPVVFVLLLLAFWPFALIYGARHWRALSAT